MSFFVALTSLSYSLVAASPTTTTLTATPNPARLGQVVTLTATVASPPTGKVTFYDGVTVLGIAPITTGTATFSTAALPSGKHSLTARYDGDATNAPSLSPAVSLTVQSTPANATTALPGVPTQYIY